MKRVLITGGAGFIGSCLARHLINNSDYDVLVYDKLTYAATLTSLNTVLEHPRFKFIQGDICNKDAVSKSISTFDPDLIVHLAAESHVDRSIEGPQAFIETNVVGTLVMLQAALAHWSSLAPERSAYFRFHHVSTDEVYGESMLDVNEQKKTEHSILCPTNPYAATKAAGSAIKASKKK